MKSFFEKKNILSDSQHGFREKRFTEHAILDIINQIENNIDNRIYSCGIFHEILSNFRPISNLKFVAKLTGKVVANRLVSYLEQNHLDEPLQSAYKKFHSCETALVRVQNDMLCAIDKRCCVALLLLDLSAAFDTVDHNILLQRLHSRFSVRGKALDWFASLHLADRTQSVVINNTK